MAELLILFANVYARTHTHTHAILVDALRIWMHKDMRLYVLVLSFRPLVIYAYRNGMSQANVIVDKCCW